MTKADTGSSAEPLLRVTDLRTQFPTARGPIQSVTAKARHLRGTQARDPMMAVDGDA
jgi:hypothetical protein